MIMLLCELHYVSLIYWCWIIIPGQLEKQDVQTYNYYICLIGRYWHTKCQPFSQQPHLLVLYHIPGRPEEQDVLIADHWQTLLCLPYLAET